MIKQFNIFRTKCLCLLVKAAYSYSCDKERVRDIATAIFKQCDTGGSISNLWFNWVFIGSGGGTGGSSGGIGWGGGAGGLGGGTGSLDGGTRDATGDSADISEFFHPFCFKFL